MKNKILFFRESISSIRWGMLLCMMFMIHVVMAQNVKVTGTIVDGVDGLGIYGATVQLKGTTVGTTTDVDGNFSLNLPANSQNGMLTVSYVGYVTYQMKLDPKVKNYKITLNENKEMLEEVVVVGYGQMKKKEITGAVSRVESEELTKISTSDVGSALQGQIAGVNVQAASGQPGSTSNIQIRGISSVNGGNNPLYVVDGVPMEGDPGLSPSEIESMDVLKDAASAAIYGTRGAGGVILITTKAGREGEMKVSVDMNYGIQKITSGLALANAAEQVYMNYLSSCKGEKIALNKFWSELWQSPNMFTNDGNAISSVEQDNQPILNASINLSGGKQNLVYNVVGNYFKQDGILINSGYERFNIRANSTFKKQKWTVYTNLSAKFDTQNSPAWGLLQQSYAYKATSMYVNQNIDVAEIDGEESQKSNYASILARFKETNENKGRGFNLNFSANYDIMKGLTFNSRFATGYNMNCIEKVNPKFEIYDGEGKPYSTQASQSRLRKQTSVNTNLSWENILNYHYVYKKHDIKATAVLSMEKYTYESWYGEREDLISNDLISLGAATGDVLVGVGTGVWGQDRTSTLIGVLGRVQYSYAGKYLLSASMRRDGSSRFAKENRWGNFPSASLGWSISEEKFWRPIKRVVNQFKIRASFGTTGNQNIGDYLTAATIVTNNDYAFVGTKGDVIGLGSTQTGFSNRLVQWETTKQYNLGMDWAFLQNKITFTADAYLSNKSDMLFPLKIPPVAGTGNSSTVVLNVGDMENKGIELALGYRNRIGKLNYRVNATYSRNINKVTRMAGTNKRSAIGSVTASQIADDITFLAEGYEAGAFLMMPTNGIVNTDEKLKEYQKLRPGAQLGDLMYVDHNGDGVIDDDDRVFCGSGAPEAEIGLNVGLNWKNIDFSMNWYTSIGNEIVNGSKAATYQRNTNKELIDQWTINNQTSTIPAYRTIDHFNMRTYADVWVEDGSFIRLKNISLGYTIPTQIIKKVKLNRLRVYVAADNLLTLTKYDGYNPEVGNNGLSQKGIDMGTYPIAMQMRCGVQLEF